MPSDQHAAQDARSIETTLRDRGTHEASQAFQTEVQRITSSSASSQTVSQHLDQLSLALEANGVLPQLSVNWAAEHFHQLDVNGDSQVSLDEINNGLLLSPSNSADHIYLSDLSRNYQSLADEFVDGPQGSNVAQTAVSQNDLQAYQTRQSDLKDNLTIAQNLLANNGFLFNALDTAHSGIDERDEKFSKHDLEDIISSIDWNHDNQLQTSEVLNSAALSGIPPEQRQAAVAAIRQLNDNWNSEEIRRLRDGDTISLNSLAEGLGIFGSGESALGSLRQYLSYQSQEAAMSTQATSPESTPIASSPSSAVSPADRFIGVQERQQLEQTLAAHPELVAAVSENGTIDQQRLSQFLNGLDLASATQLSSEGLAALQRLSESFNSISPTGAPIAVTDISSADFAPPAQNSAPADSTTTTSAPASAAQPNIYVVQPGDNLTQIAREMLGASASNQDVQDWIDTVANANGISNPNLIFPDQQLIVPSAIAA